MSAVSPEYSLSQQIENERVEPDQLPLGSYTHYRMLHQPDQIAHFINLAGIAANHPKHQAVMAPTLEASQRHLLKFGIPITRDPFEVSRTIADRRRNPELPVPASIPLIDLSKSWNRIVSKNGVMTIDFSLNGVWEANGDSDAATFISNLHMFSTGSRDTRLRLYTQNKVFARNYGNGHEQILPGDLSPDEHEELGMRLDLKNIIRSNRQLYMLMHGYAGNIEAFAPLLDDWIRSSERDRFREPFSCIAMEGLGANGSMAEQTYREIYDIEPDRITIPRYGQQIYEVLLNLGVAGLDDVKKYLIGYSMGGAGLSFAKDLIISDEAQIRDSMAVAQIRRRGQLGEDSLEVQREERINHELLPNEPLKYFPVTSFFFFNPVYRDATVMAGAYPENSPISLRARAVATHAIVNVGKYVGKRRLDRIPGVPQAVDIGTRILMGRMGPQGAASAQLHGENIRRDSAVDLQEEELRAWRGLDPTQVRNINQNNAVSVTLIGSNDNITNPKLQKAAIQAELDLLKKLGHKYVPPIVLEVPTGHGLPYDNFMRAGYDLIATLGDLDVDDRERLSKNLELVQAAINGTIPAEFLYEIARTAYNSEQAANSRLIEGSDSPSAPEYQHLYTALINATPKMMKSAFYRSKYVNELLQLMRARSR